MNLVPFRIAGKVELLVYNDRGDIETIQGVDFVTMQADFGETIGTIAAQATDRAKKKLEKAREGATV